MSDLIKDERSFPLHSIASAEVELEILTGSLRVRGGAAEFCEAVFEYSHEELRPEVEFEVDDGEAELEVTQPSNDRLQGNVRNSWDLAFNSNTDIEFGISSMSGNVGLDLDAVRVVGLDIESRSGNVALSMAGDYPELDEIAVDSTSGTVEAVLNGNFPALERVEIDSVSGRTRLVVTGECPELGRIHVDSKSGNVELDLTGSFQRDDFGVRVDAISGNVTVTVPADVGVSLQANVMSGKVRAEGFRSDGGRLVNDRMGKSVATIWLNLHAMSGNISVLTA